MDQFTAGLQPIFDFNIHSIAPATVLGTLFAALITGFLVSLIYITSHREDQYDRTFPVSLIVLTIVFSVIVLVIGNNIARAFSLGGSLAISRYRIILRNPKDGAFILIALAGGLACGAGFYITAFVFVIFLWIVILSAAEFKYGDKGTGDARILKATLPESVGFEEVFTDIFNEYLVENKLISVKTSGLGTLFEVNWRVTFKKDVSIKNFLDALRARNGNLNVNLLFDYEMNAK